VPAASARRAPKLFRCILKTARVRAVQQSLDDQYRAAMRLHQQGNAKEARRAYDRILDQRPDHAGALHLKGVLSLQVHDYDTAINLIQRSLRIQPQHGLALSNLSVALRAKGRLLESIAALEKAIVIGPPSAEAWTNLAQTQSEAGRVRDSVASARKAIALNPTRLGARHFMIFGTNYLAEVDPLVLTDDAREFGVLAAQQIPQRTRFDNDPDLDRPLRVGLVSADFKAHPVGRFLVAILPELDPARIALTAYSDTEKPDALTARFKAIIPNWHETLALDHQALCAKIVADKIDVLVDLSGHTSPRLVAFAAKPAPVSFTWLGYFATTGVQAIDYVLANQWVLPEREEPQWLEKPWRMPDTYLCFSEPQGAGPTTPLPALAEGRITFGCFNNFAKLSDATLAAWAKVLEAVPNSRLILRSSGLAQEGVIDLLLARLTELGVDLGRIRIDPLIKDYATHLRSYGEIDIALDPFPYNGGTTTVEALYMGVPVLVRAGDRYVAHMGESILHNVGLPEWIAPDEMAYPDLAAKMAADLPALAALRADLRQRMLASPLFDAPRFGRNLEDAIRGMWRVWCAAQGRG
jgi:protein O-GlcNAc transferase